MTGPFDCIIEEQTDVVVLRVRGDIDILSSQKLAERLLEARRRFQKPLVVNLEQVTYFDSCGVKVLAEHSSIEPLTIVPSPIVRRVLNLVPLGDGVRVI